MTAIRFTAADVEQAHEEWGCNCGPAALAAICGLTLEEVRAHFGAGWPGYTNPTAMIAALKRARPASRIMMSTYHDHGWPFYGLALIAFEGPWTEPNPARERWLKAERARRTHWVGVRTNEEGPTEIWDVNALEEPFCDQGWTGLGHWDRVIRRDLAASYKRATGGWHITHAIEVAR